MSVSLDVISGDTLIAYSFAILLAEGDVILDATLILNSTEGGEERHELDISDLVNNKRYYLYSLVNSREYSAVIKLTVEVPAQQALYEMESNPPEVFTPSAFGRLTDCNRDGTIVCSGHPSITGEQEGVVYVFKCVDNEWTQMGSAIYSGSTGNNFGHAVAMNTSGTRIAISANWVHNATDPYSGWVRTYEYDGSAWVSMGGTIERPGSVGQFGSSLSMNEDGDQLAVGSPYGAGIRTFQYDSTSRNWVSASNNIGSELSIARLFGSAISMSADGLMVAGIEGGWVSDVRRARIYQLVESVWQELPSVEIDLSGNHGYGGSISLTSDGSIVAIGNPPSQSARGIVEVYTYIESAWVLKGTTIRGADDHDFGLDVSISGSGERLATGGRYIHRPTAVGGFVNVYEWSETDWVLETVIGDHIVGQRWIGKHAGLSRDGSTILVRSFPEDESQARVGVYSDETAGVPLAPSSGETTVSTSDTTVTFHWEPSGKSGSGESMFLVTDLTTGEQHWVETSNPTFSLTDLSPDTTYEISVRLINGNESSSGISSIGSTNVSNDSSVLVLSWTTPSAPEESVSSKDPQKLYASSLYQSGTAAVRSPQSRSYPTSATPRLINGSMAGLRPTPAQFTGQVGAIANVHSRSIYKRAFSSSGKPELGKRSTGSMDSSARIALLRSRQAGKSSLKVGISLDSELSTKGDANNGRIHNHVSRLRRGGGASMVRKFAV